ncbi:MAG TPA: hypothetical protein VLH79_09085 [Chthonomonadales bacterium]|nr:hypothetical protein [Chthonomonadales bacterium]
MKAGPSVSPVVAVLIIVLVVAIAGFFIIRGTGPRQGMTAEQEAQLERMHDAGQLPGVGPGTGQGSAGGQQAPQGQQAP